MKGLLKKIEPFFSYSKGERNGFFVLSFILIIILGFRYYTLNHYKPVIEISQEEFDQLSAELFKEPEKSAAILAEEKKVVTTRKKYKKPIKSSDDRFPKIKLNSLNFEDWKKLRGIGDVFGNRIVKYNKLLGGFYSNNQIQEVYGIDSTLFLQICHQIEISSVPYRKLDINKATLEEMKKHPYLSGPKSKGIVQFRTEKGRFETIDELVENHLLTDFEYSRIKNYITTN